MNAVLKKCILCAVLLSLTVASIASCNNSGSRESGTEPQMSVSVSILDRGQIAASEGNYAENRWTKLINEKLGVNVTWVPVPRNESLQKLNVLVAAGQAPDIIWEYDRNYIATLINQGTVQPLEGYIEQYSTVYKEYLKNNPELLPYVTFDGEMYAITSKRTMGDTANYGMWIRQDWLDKLGLKAPETDEELLEVAKAFMERDPDGNGVNDTIGLAILQWQEMFPALYYSSALWYLEDGELKFGSTVDRYKDYLAFFKKMYEMRLIDQEFFTDKNSQNQKQLWSTGKAGILTNNWSTTLNKDLMVNVPDARPVPLEPVSTKYGKNGLWQETPAFRYVVFNKGIKNPEAGIKLVDWLIESGWEDLVYGIEGVHHQKKDGVPKVINRDINERELNYAKEYAFVNRNNMPPEWYKLMAPEDELSQKLAQQATDSLKVALKNTFRRDIPYDPNIVEVTRIVNEFVPKRDDIRMKVVLGGNDYSPEWGMEQIKNEWLNLGGKEAEKAANEWYKKNKAIFKSAN